MFRFTIRDLLWLMVVVGLACVWWGERRAWESQRNELLPRIADLDEIKKMLGSEKALTDFVEEAKAVNSMPPRPPGSVIVPINSADRVKSKPPIRPRNES